MSTPRAPGEPDAPADTGGLDAAEAAAFRLLLSRLSDGDHLERDADPFEKAEELIERIEVIEDALADDGTADRVAALEDRVAALEDQTGATGKVEKYQQIIDLAANRRNRTLDGGGVALDYNDVVDATGCSGKHAYDLMKQLGGGEGYDGFGFATFEDPADKNKRLVVHFDGRDAADLKARVNAGHD